MTLPSATTVTFTGAGGIRLTGDLWGPDDGPLVLLLHGGGQTRHSWKTTGAGLGAAGVRALALDARGHGDSEWAADRDYSRDTMADDVLAVLAELDVPAVLVGASMGGLSSLVATGRPGAERIERLVLVDIVPRAEAVGVQRVLDFLGGHQDGFGSLDEAADAIAAYLPHRTKPSNTAGLTRNLRRRADGRWYWHWDPAIMGGRLEDVQAHVTALEQAAAALRMPVLLVRGRFSDVVSAEGVAAFRRIVPQLEYAEIGNAAHTAAGDDNDAFTRVVVDFVLTSDVGKGSR